MPRIEKLIVTNWEALRGKYGSRLSTIRAAVRDLIAADAGPDREITTSLIALDDTATMRRYRARAVTDPTNCQQNKEAIDALCRKIAPEYVMILGAIDVVPHQDMLNPLYSPDAEKEEADTDYIAWGDLPYACDEPYGRDIGRFRRPTRVVGRLPDVTGGSDARYLVKLLRVASGYRSRPRSDYQAYFGISALAWKDSTELSMKNVFGSHEDLQTSPPGTPRWGKARLRRRAHFFNCHGATADTFFYGEDPETEEQPEALSARYLKAARRISEGTVVAAECCYGAELFDPSETDGQLGICNTYLQHGAYGFFGSSTTSWGPAEGNGQADLVCQYFLDRVLKGASLGRAALEARLEFIKAAGVLQPQELKTLAQFSLMGDPSVHPVARAPHAMEKSRAYRSLLAGPKRRATRAQRRAWLVRYGTAIGEATGRTQRERRARTGPRIKAVLDRALREVGARAKQHASHRVADPEAPLIRSKLGGRKTPNRVHVAIGNTGRVQRVGGRNVPQLVAVVAIVEDGRVVNMRRLHSR